jgi:antitoxin Phd
MEPAWALQDAKNRFSAVVDRALTTGPQWVTRHGRDAVVVVAAAEFRRVTQPRGGLTAFFRRSPLRGVKLDLTRSRDPGRQVDL